LKLPSWFDDDYLIVLNLDGRIDTDWNTAGGAQMAASLATASAGLYRSVRHP
jgi:hypothetical protein